MEEGPKKVRNLVMTIWWGYSVEVRIGTGVDD
jgi:hypothetical protein